MCVACPPGDVRVRRQVGFDPEPRGSPPYLCIDFRTLHSEYERSPYMLSTSLYDPDLSLMSRGASHEVEGDMEIHCVSRPLVRP